MTTMTTAMPAPTTKTKQGVRNRDTNGGGAKGEKGKAENGMTGKEGGQGRGEMGRGGKGMSPN